MYGRDKGLNFEIKIAKDLSYWYTKNKSKKIFWRMISSGGLYTNKVVDSLSGDIMAIDSEGEKLLNEITIECKCRKKIDLDSFLTTPEKNEIFSFWKQVTNVKDKIPFLIVKSNYKPILLFLPYNFIVFFEPYLKSVIYIKSSHIQIGICKWDEFLNNINKEMLFKIIEKYKIQKESV